MDSSRLRLRFLSLLANSLLRLGTTRLMNSSPDSILSSCHWQRKQQQQ
jgi:hypothetical protein